MSRKDSNYPRFPNPAESELVLPMREKYVIARLEMSYRTGEILIADDNGL